MRVFLIGGICLLSLLLVVEWQAFQYAQRVQFATDSSTSQTLPTNRPPNQIPPPAQELPAVSQRNELPTSNLLPTPQEQATQASHLVTAKSNNLLVTIDLQGGDITGVELLGHPIKVERPNASLPLLRRERKLEYIAQSGLIGAQGTDTGNGRPLFQAQQTHYVMTDGSDTLIVPLLYRTASGQQIEKRFTLTRDSYQVELDYAIKNNNTEPWSANFFAQLKRDSERPPEEDLHFLGVRPFLGAATRNAEKPYIKMSFSKMKKKPFWEQVNGGWLAILQHYFLVAWVPQPGINYEYSTAVTRDGSNLIRLVSPALTLAPGQQGEFKATLYAGPKDQARLKELSPGLELTVDYGFLWWLSQPLFYLLKGLHGLTSNWGWAIVLLTLMVKIAFYPLSAASFRSMAKMHQLQPEMTSIRESYKEDPEKMREKMMDLYSKEKINPLNGCLPILVQMPVFLALYWVLLESYELRHSPFMFWIKDLSVQDPYYVLPVLMGASMWYQQRLNPLPADPTQAQVMRWLPVIFTIFFLWFPAGLVLYWLVNNILTICQQWFVVRNTKKTLPRKRN